LIGAEGGDSWSAKDGHILWPTPTLGRPVRRGISVTGEIPQEPSDEEAHRTPPGKRPPGAEINSPVERTKFKGTFSVPTFLLTCLIYLLF